MGNVLAVGRREFRSYFDQATAYILLVIFLATNYFFYFRSVLFTGQATLRPMFDLLPWLLLFFVPAITMRALAEERSTGTLELMLTQPITEIEFLLGKFLGVFGFLVVALAGTSGAVIALEMGGEPFWGVMLAQYIGALLLVASLVGIGLWASSLTRNQITAFILGVAVTFFLIVISLDVVLLGLPPILAAAAERLGILTHFDSVGRGVIDLRDVVYFATLAGAFLSLAYWSVQRQKLSRRGMAYRTLWAGTLGILGICIVVNLLGRHIRGRLDLTPGNAYTLSEASRSLLRGLDDLVTVRFFASRELPPQVGIVRRDIEDLLSDFRSVAGGNLQLIQYTPEGNNEARDEAARFGIPPIQFNVLGQEEFQVRQGYLGIALQYADQVETLPFIRQTEDLEYRLASAIRRITVQRRPTVGFLTGHGEPDMVGELSTVADRLRESYNVIAVNITEDEEAIPDSVRVLVLPGPQSALSAAEGRKLGEFLAVGGNMLIMAQPVTIDQTGLFPMPLPLPQIAALLAKYGVSLPDGLAYDLRSNGRVTVPTAAGLSFVIPYPLWVQALPATSHVIVDRLSSVMAPWTTPIEVVSGDSTNVIPLLATTEFGGKLTGRLPLNPQFDWNSVATDLSRQLIAVALTPPAPGVLPAAGASRPSANPVAGAAAPDAGAAALDAGEGAAAAPARDGGEAAGQNAAGAGDQNASGAGGDSLAMRPAEQPGAETTPPPTGRIVLIGDTDFATTRFVQASPDNLLFVQNAVDWLAEDEALISIRTKSRTPPPLLYPSEAVRDAAKYGNLIGVPLLFVLLGTGRVLRRRRLQSQPYRPGGAAA